MTSRLLVKLFAILALFMCMLFSVNSLAQQAKFTATIYTRQGSPIFVEDFHLIDGKDYYDAVQNGKDVKIPFEQIKTIEFIAPGKRGYEADITFNDGKKGKYRLKKPGSIEIITKLSKVTMSHTRVAKIEFGTSQKKRKTKPVEIIGNVDRIILKNGDNLSGQLQTKAFTLKTSYGSFNFEVPQISYIDFDAKGKDKGIDVIVLKVGDRLSGVVEIKSVKFLLRSGKEVSFEGEAIKKIMMKK